MFLLIFYVKNVLFFYDRTMILEDNCIIKTLLLSLAALAITFIFTAISTVAKSSFNPSSVIISPLSSISR